MKKAFLLAILCAALASCQSTGDKQAKTGEVNAMAVRQIELTVEGMTCTGCEQTIQESVAALEGVTEVKADHVAGKTTVSFDTTLTGRQAIADAITATGYTVLP